MLTQWYARGRSLLVFRVLAVIGVTALVAQAVNGTISDAVPDPSGA